MQLLISYYNKVRYKGIVSQKIIFEHISCCLQTKKWTTISITCIQYLVKKSNFLNCCHSMKNLLTHLTNLALTHMSHFGGRHPASGYCSINMLPTFILSQSVQIFFNLQTNFPLRGKVGQLSKRMRVFCCSIYIIIL